MTEYGFALSSEEHAPNDLVRYARMGEDAGFTFALISDHYHPWIDRQGHSAFVWSVIGGIAHNTERLRLGTGVTCPTIRIHPAIIAQAAATCAAMLPGRFFLGAGTGENLNEHILGDKWPPVDTRREMLREAVEIIRELWKGDMVDYHGAFYDVEDARIYTLPEQLPPIYVAASGELASKLAGEIGDGLIATSPDDKLARNYLEQGGKGPRYGQISVCWAETEQQGVQTAKEWWPNTVVPGELTAELPLPRHFEQASKMATEEMMAKAVVCGPDPSKHIEKIRSYIEAGYDQIYMHQIGPDQEGFFRFYQNEVLPQVQQEPAVERRLAG